MRKIEKEMLDAIADGREWIKDNTYVNPVIGGIEVWLFDNHIATVEGSNVLVNRETLAEYPTVTTKSRLRALGVDIEQRKGKIFIDGKFVCDS